MRKAIVPSSVASRQLSARAEVGGTVSGKGAAATAESAGTSASVSSQGPSGSASGNSVYCRAVAGFADITLALKACCALSSARSESADAEESVCVLCILSVTSFISSSPADPAEETEEETEECTGVCSTRIVDVGGGCHNVLPVV